MASVVPAVDEVLDGGGQVLDGGEAAAADGLAGDDAEEDLDHVQPGRRGRGEVRGDPGVLRQPRRHVLALAGAVVVGDDAQRDARVRLRDLAQEREEWTSRLRTAPRPCRAG